MDFAEGERRRERKNGRPQGSPLQFCGDAHENTVGADIIRQQKGNPEGSLPRGEGGFFGNLLSEKTKEGLKCNPEGLSQFIRDYPSSVAFGDSSPSGELERADNIRPYICLKMLKEILNTKPKRAPKRVLFLVGWGGGIRTHEMQESKSCALPLGDAPILNYSKNAHSF